MSLKKTASQLLSKYCFFNQLAQKTDPAINPAALNNTPIKTEPSIMQTPASQQGPQAAAPHEPSNLPYLSLDDLSHMRPLTFEKSAGEITIPSDDTSSLKFK